jgi:hypothetical protein
MMGDVADMMLDGTLCAGCGVYIGNDVGPSYCDTCKAKALEDFESQQESNELLESATGCSKDGFDKLSIRGDQ